MIDVDDPRQLRVVYDAILLGKCENDAATGLAYLFELLPWAKRCTHQHIADTMGLARETVTRNFAAAEDF